MDSIVSVTHCCSITCELNGNERVEIEKEADQGRIFNDDMSKDAGGYELCLVPKHHMTPNHIPANIVFSDSTEKPEAEKPGRRAGISDPNEARAKTVYNTIRDLLFCSRKIVVKSNFRILTRDETPNQSTEKIFAEKLKRILQMNYPDPDFNVQKMSRLLNMSRPTVFRKVKATTGESPTKLIRIFRLERAATLLQNNCGNVTDIAFDVGFSNSAYFAKCFKDKYNQTPTEYKLSGI